MAHLVDMLTTDSGGSIHLISGPMFSGKTTELIRRIRTAQAAGLSCALLRPIVDTRWKDRPAEEGKKSLLQTHASQHLLGEASVELRMCEKIADATFEKTPRIVAIDEGQFFPDLSAGSQAFAARGAHVIVAALDGTFAQTPFPQVSSLYPICEDVVKLRAVCMGCKERAAPFTVLLKPQKREPGPGPESGTGYVNVGGADKYAAVCRRCLALP